MKSIYEVHRGLNDKEANKRAKQIDEPFVAAALKEIGWQVSPGTYDEDFKHIDLKVFHTPKGNKIFSIDVKRSNRENAYSPNFLITTVSNSGTKFPFSDKDFFAFIDDSDSTITIIKQSKIEKLIKDYKLKEQDSHNDGIGKFVLLNKKLVKQNADKIIEPSNFVKELLCWL